MNIVWPITALYFGPLALWGYRRSGWKMTEHHHARMLEQIPRELQQESAGSAQMNDGAAENRPSREQVAVAVSHCGAGCTLGDIAAEWWVFAAGLSFAGGEFSTRLTLDFLLAWGFGIIFQYLTIAPMRGLSLRKGLIEAVRADTLSIVSFEVGLFAWMALTYYVLFPMPHLKPTEPAFWFMMQVGMIIGFFTSYPVNVFLIRKGWKEKMPKYKLETKAAMRNQQANERRAA